MGTAALLSEADDKDDKENPTAIGDGEREAGQEGVASPFIPGTHIQFAWDSTSLGYFKTCPRLYQYQIIEGWATQGEAIHLRFGIEYHQALHDYETSKAAGIGHNDAVHDTVRALIERIHNWHPEPTTKSEELKTKDHLLRTVIWYLDHFKDDPAKTVILDNGKPAVELSFRFELDWGPFSQPPATIDEVAAALTVPEQDTPPTVTVQPYVLCGHLDRVVEFQDDLYIMDRKTTTTTPGPYYFNQFEPNNQMTLYTLASQVILTSPIKGVIIDAIQVAANFSRPVRSFTYRTNDQLEEWLGDLRYLLAQAEDYAAEGYWPMNDTACDKFGGCRFRTICSKSPQVREQFLKSNFVKLEPEQRWNPLKARG